MPQVDDGTGKLRDSPAPTIGPPNGPTEKRVSRIRHGVTVKKSSDPVPGGAKYPLISITRSVAWVAKTEIAPLTPAGTIAAFAVTIPGGAFSVETSGWDDPAGHVVRKPRTPGGTTVMLKEYAWAVAGIPQGLAGTGMSRATAGASDGPPNGPAALRVSAMRQGVTGGE